MIREALQSDGVEEVFKLDEEGGEEYDLLDAAGSPKKTWEVSLVSPICCQVTR